MIFETINLLHEVYGAEKKLLLSQVNLSSSGLKYLCDHPESASRSGTQFAFYETLRFYLTEERVNILDSSVRREFLQKLREYMLGMPPSVHRISIIERIDKLAEI